MAKELKFSIAGASASYAVGPSKVVAFQMPEGFTALGDFFQKAVIFAVKTALRNARADIPMEQVDEAFKAVADRAASFAAGVWTARREASGEPRSSLLAQALAAVLQVDAKEAAEYISAKIEEALKADGIDPEAELEGEEKKKAAAIASTVRKEIQKDPAVSLALSELKLAADTAKVTAAKARAATEKSQFV